MPVDYLLGQKVFKLLSLPPAAAAVPCRCAAAAEVDARAAPPHRHRAAWFGAHLRSPAAASRPCAAGAVKHVCAFCAARESLVSYVCSPAWVGTVVCRMSRPGLCVRTRLSGAHLHHAGPRGSAVRLYSARLRVHTPVGLAVYLMAISLKL